MKRKFRAILGVNSQRECYTNERHDVWGASFRAAILAWNGQTTQVSKIILNKETYWLCGVYYYLMYYDADNHWGNSPGFLIKSTFV